MGIVIGLGVFIGVLAAVAWRLAIQPSMTRVARSMLGLLAGSFAGCSGGLLLGGLLGEFVGMNPGDPHNLAFLAVAFAMLGIVIGGLGGLLAVGRVAAGRP